MKLAWLRGGSPFTESKSDTIKGHSCCKSGSPNGFDSKDHTAPSTEFFLLCYQTKIFRY